jgi:hypothetical protein
MCSCFVFFPFFFFGQLSLTEPSHSDDIFAGAQTIRAYGVQQRFIHESEDKVDFNQVCYYPSIIANRSALLIL